jgi:hypothetical protein
MQHEEFESNRIPISPNTLCFLS